MKTKKRISLAKGKQNTPSRYVEIAGDSLFEPGSGGKVMKNKLSIRSISKLHDEEIKRYRRATLFCFSHFSGDHSFTMKDVYFIHRKIFNGLYDWAGKQRNIDLSKDGFMFTRAIFLKDQEIEFENTILKKLTPAGQSSKKKLAKTLAMIHVEFILLHPFREGNGRTVRLLLMLIAQQAGFEQLLFPGFTPGSKGYTGYIKAIHEGQAGNYQRMIRLMEKAIV